MEKTNPVTEDKAARLADLLSRCALGDQGAFNQLYHLTSSKLYGVAIFCLRRKDLADEVLQESYVRIWHRAGQFQVSQSAALTWMTAIVRNSAIDRLRQLKDESPLDDAAERAHEEAEGHDPMSLTAQKRDAQKLHDCLMQLEAEQRQCIVRAYFHGATNNDLAHEFQKPLGTVKSWLRRGLLLLRGCVEA